MPLKKVANLPKKVPMKNHMSVLKSGILRIFRSLFAYSWIYASITLMSFTPAGNGGPLKTKTEDSTKFSTSEKAFKSFFNENDETTVSALINPAAMPFVEDYAKKEAGRLENLVNWGRTYLSLYERILEQYGLPKELKYLSVVESQLQSKAVSHAGAVGPWQLMAVEAKRLGLKVNRKKDERRDYTKSTHAAAKMLKSLYESFGDWLLVIAAYNVGPSRVMKAMAKHNSRSFWDIQYSLPAETRNHVKKFISTHYILEGGGGITTMTRDEMLALNKEDINNSEATDSAAAMSL